MWPNAPLGDWVVGLRRRWWLILGLPALTVLLAVARPPVAAPSVEARLMVAIDVQPDADAADAARELVDRLARHERSPTLARVAGDEVDALTEVGEALVDDLSRILPGDAFSRAVTARLSDGLAVVPGEIQGNVSSEDRHRVMDIAIRRTTAPGVAIGDRAAADGAAASAARSAPDQPGSPVISGPHHVGTVNQLMAASDSNSTSAISRPSTKLCTESPTTISRPLRPPSCACACWSCC